MPYCKPHSFVFLSICHVKTEDFELPLSEYFDKIRVVIKANPNRCKLRKAGQSLARVSLSPLAILCAVSLCAENGQYPLFAWTWVCIASEDKG
jgi:hypothetical protein